jgi:hypothetical protein
MTQRGPQPKYKLTEERRLIIQERYIGRQGKSLSDDMGVPVDVLRKWARIMGVARKTGGPWTREDEAYLRDHIGNQTMKQLSKVLHRSDDAIKCKCDRLGLSYATNEDDGYSLNEVMEGLVCSQEIVTRWAKARWIKGRRKLNVLGFSDNEIRRFLQEHPEEVSQEVMGSLWVRDLLHSPGGMGSLARDCE